MLRDSNAVNLESIVLGGDTLKELSIPEAPTIHPRCKLPIVKLAAINTTLRFGIFKIDGINRSHTWL